MKKFIVPIRILCTGIFFLALLTGCETIIDPKLAEANDVLVVDAWLDTEVKEQTIRLSLSQPYFDNSDPRGISNAKVTVTNETQGRVFEFLETWPDAKRMTIPGTYFWRPSGPNESIGEIG